MATVINRWSPDTCGCVLEYQWDDALPPEGRVHTWANTVETGPEHAGLAGAALFAAVLEENQRKNFTLAETQELMPDTDPDDYSWRFGPGRVLEASFAIPLSDDQRAALQERLDRRFGSGRVVVA